MEEGHIFIEGEINQNTLKAIQRQVAQNSTAETLILHIASPGGSVYDGYKMYHVLKGAGKKIKAIIEGEAQSMATFIACAADPGEVEIKDPSVYMIHNPSQGVKGDADALDGGAAELRMIENEMANVYAKRTGKPVEEIKQMMKKETRMTASDAVRYGFADKLGTYLKAVAVGTPMINEESRTLLEKLGDQVKTLTEKLTGASKQDSPKAVELPLKDGSILNVEGEGDLMGKPATLNGEPAPDGEHMLADGRMIVTAGGVVSEVREAAPVETPEQKLQKQVADLQTQLQKAEADKLASTQSATQSKEEIKQAAQAVAKIEKELSELKKQTIGDGDKPDKGMTPNRKPVGYSSGPNAVALDLTKAFIKEHMNWLHPHYEEGYFDNTPSMTSILETNFNYTYPGILTTDIFYKPTLTAPALSDIFTIDQDIKFKKVYNLVTQLDKIVKPYTGCGAGPNTDRQFITNTEVQTKEFRVYEGWCKDDFTKQLTGIYNNLAQEWLKTGEDSFDPAGTPIDKVIMTVLKDAIQRDIFRRVSFAAGNSSDVDYSQFDGLWDRNIDSSGAANYCVRRAGSSIAGALSAGNALTHLETAYTQSNILLKNRPDKKYLVTRSIWDNYYNSLIGNGSVTEQAFSNLQKGLTTLTYKGIPVIPVDLWDQFLTEPTNPLYSGGSQRNLIMLTVKENHILGVENGADLNKIDSWFEKKDDKRYYRSDFKLGYNYLHCDLTTIMY